MGSPKTNSGTVLGREASLTNENAMNFLTAHRQPGGGIGPWKSAVQSGLGPSGKPGSGNQAPAAAAPKPQTPKAKYENVGAKKPWSL